MVTAEALIATEDPESYLTRLGKHAAKMGSGLGHRPRVHGGGRRPPEVRHAQWSAASGTIQLDIGRWTMQAAPGMLRLRAEAADETSLRLIQDMLTARLEKFGRRERLTVTWTSTLIKEIDRLWG